MRINDHSYAGRTGDLNWHPTKPSSLVRAYHSTRRQFDRELIDYELVWRLDYFDGHVVQYSPYYFVYRPETLKYL